MQRKQARVLNLAVLLAMLLSLVTGPLTARAASSPSGAAALAVQPFTKGNIVVLRVGDGSGALAGTATKAFLDEYSPAGTLVQSIAVPDMATAPNHPLLLSGSSTAEGLLTRSVNGQYLLFGGYATTAGGTTGTSAPATTPRVIGRVDSSGSIDTSTALTNLTGNIRSAASTDGQDLWATSSSVGVNYVKLGGSTGTQLSTAPTNTRQANIFGGQLYVTAATASAPYYRIAAVGTGIPTASGQTTANLPGITNTQSTSPYGIFFADLSSDVPGIDTLYAADDSLGIQKYSWASSDGTNYSWVLNGKVAGNGSYRGVTGVVNGSSVTLFIVNASSTTGSKLDQLVDTSGYNDTGVFSTLTVTNLASAATNTAFRGVALAPVSAVDAPPAVVKTTPAAGDSDVALNTTITVAFNESVKTTGDAFTLSCGGVGQPFKFNGLGAYYTITPLDNLPLNAQCTLTITGSKVADEDNPLEVMDPDYTMSFHTTSDVAPVVLSTVPAKNVDKVAVDSNISVTFSEDVNAPEGAFEIRCNTVTQAFAISPASGPAATFTLDPTSSLPYSQDCTVTVSADMISDVDGTTVNQMASDYSWTFTTQPDPNAITPIADARVAGAGWTGNLQGNVTVLPNIYRGNAFVIQDATGGMYIYTGSLTLPQMAMGDVVKVNGTIKNYSGMLETDPTNSVTRISTGTIPATEKVATGSVGPTQGKLITVEGTATITGTAPVPGASDFKDITINDGSGAVMIFVDKDTKIDMSSFVTGQKMRVTGYSSAFTTGPQVMPRYQTDVVDLRPATVTNTVPASEATGVSLYKPVSVTFSNAMDLATLTADNFTLTTASGSVTGTVSYDAGTHTAFFTPDAALEPSTPYTADLSASILDANGTPIAPYTWGFTTGAVDDVAPSIVTRSPDKSAGDVAISAAVTITFSEELNPASLDLSHFVLAGPNGTVAASLIYNTAAFAVTLTPDAPLAYSTEYTVKVTGNTADYAGNTLGADDTWTFTTMAEPPMRTYFGDLHNHTSYSDGSGTPAQALAAGKSAGFDFMAISDHSYAIDDTEWASTLSAVNDATSSTFVGLRGFEYTQGAEGHINVFNSTRHAVRTNTGCTYCDYTPNLEKGATVNGFYPWLVSPSAAALDASGIVMQFNHPGWINFNDWFYHPEVSDVARLEEVGNGSGTSYVFSEAEYLRSLDYGWKLGATNNADTHSTYWGVNTNHRTGVLMPELTRAALLEALRERRTFATEDKNFSLSMKANGAWMGSEIENTGSVAFDINGADPDSEPAGLVELITDQGKVLDSKSFETASFNWQPSVNITTGVHFFYVKVTQPDGDKIVTSPVWTKGTEDISVTDIRIQPTIPTIYSPSLLTARITNRVAEPRTVSVVIKIGDTPLGAAKEVTVPANGDGFVNFDWQPAVTGNVTVTAEMTGVPAGDNPDDNSASLHLTVTDEHLPLILIDASHGNINATGDEMRAYVNDLSLHHFNVLKNLDELTASDLNPDVVKLLIITAPQTAYTDAEQTAIANFVNAGGSLWIGGLADYNKSVTWADTVADRENAILDKIEGVTQQQINMRMNDDEVIDGNSNNGYVFGVIWQSFPSADTTGIGRNVESVSTWSLSSIRGRTVNDPLTADTPGVQIVMQGDLDDGYTNDTFHNPNHTSNTDYDKGADAYIYNPTWVYPSPKPTTGLLPLPGAAVTDLPGTPGRIMLYGDSNDPFTTFAYTAGDGKQNELFNLESVMWLLGQPLQKSTIAEARAQTVEDVPNNLNNLVWVEGEITAAYGEFFNVLYVQDGTGGLTVHAPAGDIDPSAFTRGTKVRVIGTVETYNGDTEIQFFEAEMVQVIGPSTGDPAPKALITAQASLEANEGWLVSVSGKITAKTGTDTLFVDDGSGPVRVFLDGYNGDFTDLKVNDLVRVTGLASEDGDGQRIRVRNYKLHTAIADDVTVLDQVLSLNMSVSTPDMVSLGSKVTYTIELTNVGTTDAQEVTLTDVLPAGVTFDAFVENSASAQQDKGTLTWNGTIKTTEKVRVVFTATVNPDEKLYGATISNTAAYTSTNAFFGSATADFQVHNGYHFYLLNVVVNQ